MWNHVTIIRTGITCKKLPCYMRDSARRWHITKKVIFWIYVIYFWTLWNVKNCRILIVLCKWIFKNHPIIFLSQHNKTKLVSASVFVSGLFPKTKINFSLQNFNRYNLSVQWRDKWNYCIYFLCFCGKSIWTEVI